MNKYALTRKVFAGLAPEDFVSNYISHIDKRNQQLNEVFWDVNIPY